VIWLTGIQGAGTLSGADQANLAGYLDGGGRLFVSGQDIGFDIGDTGYYQDYLHAAYDSDDTNGYELTGLDYLAGLDVTIQGSGGANNQLFPSDITPVNGGVAVYDYPPPHLYGGVAYSGTYRTVYFSFGYEAIDSQGDREGVMSATLGYLGVCGEPAAPEAGFESSSPDEMGSLTVFTNTTQGTAWMAYSWDFGDGTDLSQQANPSHLYAQGDQYTVVLTATNRYGQSVYSDTVQIESSCIPVTGADFVYDPPAPRAGGMVSFTAVVTAGSHPLTYTWDFGDGSEVGVGNPITHSFPMTMPTIYTVTLTVSNLCPSQETVRRPVNVWQGVFLPLVLK
jgi:PKD repeat protein